MPVDTTWRLIDQVMAEQKSNNICLLTEEEVEARRKIALDTVEKLDQQGCADLLSRWLISLGACDGSLMMSVRRIGAGSGAKSVCQGPAVCGVISGPDEQVSIGYFVHGVDLGPKPAEKIRSKGRTEREILASF